MPNGRLPSCSRAASPSPPSAGIAAPSGGDPGTISPARPLYRGRAENLPADLVPLLAPPLHLEQPAHQVLIAVISEHRLGNRHAGRRTVHHPRLVGRADRTRGDNAQVSTGPPGRGEPLDPAIFTQPRLERDARDARACDLHNRRADLPLLADHRSGDVEAHGGDVLAKLPVPELAPEPLHPPVQVLAGIGVHRLFPAAVVLGVGLLVAVKPEEADPDPARGRALVYRGPGGPAVDRQASLLAGVDRDHPRVRHKPHRIRRLPAWSKSDDSPAGPISVNPALTRLANDRGRRRWL